MQITNSMLSRVVAFAKVIDTIAMNKGFRGTLYDKV